MTEETFSTQSAPPWLCNPSLCDGSHIVSLSPEKLEQFAKHLLSSTYLAIMFQLLLQFFPPITTMIKLYLNSLNNSISILAKESLLEKFRLEFITELRKVSIFGDDSLLPISTWFGSYLLSLRDMFDLIGTDKDCFGYVKAENYQYMCNRFSTPWLLRMMLPVPSRGIAKNGADSFKREGWKKKELDTFTDDSMIDLITIFGVELEKCKMGKWIKYLNQNMSAMRLFKYAETTVSSMKLSQGSPESISLPFRSTLITWWAHMIDSNVNSELFDLAQGAKQFKAIADTEAACKNYEDAVFAYEISNFLGVPSPDLIHSLTNCAAIRLRIAKEDPNQILFAILECTFALQIDPNHVKALFRRGLGLALCKKWNEAIVDFERALELDPNSPAKKELEVARRQVTRRIGN